MKSKKLVLILVISIFIFKSGTSWAQKDSSQLSEVEQVKAELLQDAAQITAAEAYQPKWQEDFRALQLQANDLMARNLKLNIEQKTLQNEIMKLEIELQEKQEKNQEVRGKIEEQKSLMDEKAWKAKTAAWERQYQDEMDAKNSELKEYQSKLTYLEQIIEVARLKLKLMGIEDNSDKLLAVQEQRDVLEAQIISQAEREKKLTLDIGRVKDERKPIDPAVAVLRDEIDILRKEIVNLENKNKSIMGQSGPTPEEQIKILTKQQADMIIDNSQFKAKIDKYKSDKKMGIDNSRIKQLVEAISAVDTANNNLNEEISYLRENIAILKNRVKKLNYQAESMNAIKQK